MAFTNWIGVKDSLPPVIVGLSEEVLVCTQKDEESRIWKAVCLCFYDGSCKWKSSAGFLDLRLVTHWCPINTQK